MSLKDIEGAYNRIRNIANKTPIMTSRTLNSLMKASVYLKCENFQRTGSFKFRGAYSTLSLLTPEQKKLGVITHSSGNHAQAVSLAALILGIKATIVMPKDAPIVKVNATKEYGADIVFCENSLESRISTTKKIISETNGILIHPYDNDNVIYGQGTASYELIKEVGDLDSVIAPLGGGGLLSGTAISVNGLCPSASIIGVEPAIADDAYRSMRLDKLVPSTYPKTIADGLRTSLSDRTFKIIKDLVDNIVTVSEREIIEGMKFLWERMKIVVEPSGAVPIAALFTQKIETQGKKIGVILSGGNIMLDDFFNKLEKKYRIKTKEK